MRLLVTTNARLYKKSDGTYWTSLVYGYDFFLRYLKVFEEVKLVAHCEEYNEETMKPMLRVDGPNLMIHGVPFPHGKKEYIKMYSRINHLVKESLSDCDAAILRIPDQLAFQIFHYLKKEKIPVGVEVTSDSWDLFAPGAAKSILRPIIRLLWHWQQRHVCRSAAGTAYVTKYAIQKRYPPATKRGFTTNYSDVNIIDFSRSSARKYKESTNRLIIIHVSGNIGGLAKGHFELIKAVGLLKAKGLIVDVVLVGGGDLSERVVSAIHEYHLEDQIRFTGLLNQNQLFEELLNADLFVFPSYREGLPRSVIEAMAATLPCIATDLPGIRELLDSSCLVPVRNSTVLFEKLEDLITNPHKLEELSRQNYEKSKEYSIDIIEKKRNAFYKRIKMLAKDHLQKK